MGEEIWKTIAVQATPSVILAAVAYFGLPFLRRTLEKQQEALQAQHETEKAYLKAQLAECRDDCRQALTAVREEHRQERREWNAAVNRFSADVELLRETIERMRHTEDRK